MAIDVQPGQVVGARIFFDYRGPKKEYWIGFGISPHRTRGDIYQWVGAFRTLPASSLWLSVNYMIAGYLMNNPPEPGQHHECYAFIGTGPGAGEIKGEWTDDVYKILP